VTARLRGARPALTVIAALAAGGMCGPVAAAELRHEYVPPEALLEAAAALGSVTRFEPPDRPGGVPRGLTRDGERLPAPRDDRSDAPRVGEGRAAGGQPPPDILRPDRTRPDRDTGVDANLTYHAVYNPEVAPLRRNVAFDVVGPAPDYELSIRPDALVAVPVIGVGGGSGPEDGPTAGREAFYGDLAVDLRPGVPAPVPSVAPDMRLLALRTEPPTDAVFLRDSADNFYVRANHQGNVRLVFVVDADRRYFSGTLPGNVPLDVAIADPDARLEPAARAAARRVHAHVGVEASMPFDRGLERLVGHFRGFVAGTLPRGDGDLYLDLALGGTGVCRHRAFAFLVTARALGVPTRYVQNEAHAFVEVRVPDGSWRRVDLGGQAPNLDLRAGEGGRLHTPPPDAFPKPESYLSGYSAQLLQGQGTGRGPDGRPKPGTLTPLGPGARAEAGVPGPRAEIPLPGEPGAPADPTAVSAGGPDAGPGSFLSAPPGGGAGGAAGTTPGATPAPAPPAATRLVLDGHPGGEVFRGEDLPFEATGRLTDPGGTGVAGVRIQVFLLPVEGGSALAVGVPVRTAADGGFRARLRLPQTLPLGRYRLVAASEGDARTAASRSDAP
jgi:hypothetical protein